MTHLMAPVLEVLGEVFFMDDLLPDEHVSYTAKTTRASHCHVLGEEDIPSRRFQFEFMGVERCASRIWGIGWSV